ncbi:MAG: chitobiase/beta-hexosaminidase C-terminal domain-containing protein [Agathobacter sp.]|nr:chitobiase/beta-hexosaminidase C-terminal domain-containing protein [Agathobacter sp.]
MKCANCGEELRDGCLYCSSCGKEAQIVPDYNVLEDEYLKALLDPDNQEQESSLTNQTTAQTDKSKTTSRKRKNNKAALIAIIFVVLILIAVFSAVIYVQIQTKQNNSFDYQITQAQMAEEEDDIETAISYYEKALSLDPNNIEIRRILTDIYMDRNDHDSAMMLCREILQRDSKNKEAYETLIKIYDSKADYDSILALKEGIEDKQILKLFEDYQVATPRFSMAGGEYQEYITVELSSAAGHEVYYTVNGKEPIENGSLYEEPISLDKMGEYTIQAVCKNEKGLYSNVITLTYTIDIPAPNMPTVTPGGGTYNEETLVSVRVPSGCTAYYTWDGTEPNITSNKYTEAFPIPEGNHVLSVILIDNDTEKISEVYQEIYMYYPQ